MSILYGTVKQISNKGLDIMFPDGAEGHVPLDEVFVTPRTPVVSSYLAYDHPVSIVVGQSIPVIPLAEKKGRYSRKGAALSALQTASVGDIVSATITEISARDILVEADTGFDMCLPRAATDEALREVFKERRLNPEISEPVDTDQGEREREEQWLYIRDRIKVRIEDKNAEPYVIGQLMIRGDPVQADPTSIHVTASEAPTAPSSTYEDILIVDDDLGLADALDHYFRDGGYRTHFVINLEDLRKWHERLDDEYRGLNIERGGVLALVKHGSSLFDWEAVCTYLVRELSAIDTIITSAANKPLTTNEGGIVASKAFDLHIRGLWNESEGLEALSTTINRQSAMSQTLAAQSAQQNSPADPATGKERVGEDVGRYRTFAQDCEIVLKALLEAAGEQAKPCAAILFQIHRKGHGVTIVASCGDDSIVAAYKRFLHHLHKSPVRDLAVFRRGADTDNASDQDWRYLYFLKPLKKLGDELSVWGLRLSVVSGNPFAYAAFLFSLRANAFRDNPRLSEEAKQWFRRALELALTARSLDQRNQRLRQLAERAADFQYMAHEAVGCLKFPAETVPALREQADIGEPGRQTLCGGVLRAYAVLTQFLPGQEMPNEEFSPRLIVTEMLNLCQSIEVHPAIQLNPRIDIGDDIRVRGRRLSFECVLRNVVLNAVQQIGEYCSAAGKIDVHIEIQRDKTQGMHLVATVTDEGPGIHGKHWKAIFQVGTSTRKKGTGLGLAVSRKLISEARGSIDLIESFLYGGTAFRISMPVNDVK